jgi:hypothetical protein
LLFLDHRLLSSFVFCQVRKGCQRTKCLEKHSPSGSCYLFILLQFQRHCFHTPFYVC